ncbi:MAG: archease [Candidatus Aenigmatarchaeota archaeon]
MSKLSKKFEVLDITTADIAISAYGKELEELFKNAAIGMISLITDIENVEKKIKKEINMEAYDLESLMFNWLNELLFYFDAYFLIFSDFKINIEKSENEKIILHAICHGDKISKRNYQIKEHIKAATYHELKIEKNDVWKANIIFDI